MRATTRRFVPAKIVPGFQQTATAWGEPGDPPLVALPIEADRNNRMGISKDSATSGWSSINKNEWKFHRYGNAMADIQSIWKATLNKRLVGLDDNKHLLEATLRRMPDCKQTPPFCRV